MVQYVTLHVIAWKLQGTRLSTKGPTLPRDQCSLVPSRTTAYQITFEFWVKVPEMNAYYRVSVVDLLMLVGVGNP